MTILPHRYDGPSPPRKLRSVRPWADCRDALELALGTGPRWLPNCRSGPDGLSPHGDLGVACLVRGQMEPRPEIQDLVWDGEARPERYESYLATRFEFLYPTGRRSDWRFPSSTESSLMLDRSV